MWTVAPNLPLSWHAIMACMMWDSRAGPDAAEDLIRGEAPEVLQELGPVPLQLQPFPVAPDSTHHAAVP